VPDLLRLAQVAFFGGRLGCCEAAFSAALMISPRTSGLSIAVKACSNARVSHVLAKQVLRGSKGGLLRQSRRSTRFGFGINYSYHGKSLPRAVCSILQSK